MFNTIVVATENSETDNLVFEKALSLAQMVGAKLIMLHVLSEEEEEAPMPIPSNLQELYPAVGNDKTLNIWREEWEEFKKQGIELLRSRQKKALQVGVRADYHQVTGSPGKTICDLAGEEEADLIVVGHRGRSGLTEMILGSVSSYVLHHASCSVLMVQ
ncbi:MAG: universal stress protein [Spirulinaceae cyanobacterium]